MSEGSAKSPSSASHRYSSHIGRLSLFCASSLCIRPNDNSWGDCWGDSGPPMHSSLVLSCEGIRREKTSAHTRNFPHVIPSKHRKASLTIVSSCCCCVCMSLVSLAKEREVLCPGRKQDIEEWKHTDAQNVYQKISATVETAVSDRCRNKRYVK